jgi:hypothetical protein
MFHVMPEVSMAPLEELFGARAISFLIKKELLPHESARMLLNWRQRAREKKIKKYRLTK